MTGNDDARAAYEAMANSGVIDSSHPRAQALREAVARAVAERPARVTPPQNQEVVDELLRLANGGATQ